MQEPELVQPSLAEGQIKQDIAISDSQLDRDTDPRLQAITDEIVQIPFVKTADMLRRFEDYFSNRTIIDAYSKIRQLKESYLEQLSDSAKINFANAGQEYLANQNLGKPFSYFRNLFIPKDTTVIALTDLEANFHFLKETLISSQFVERAAKGEKVALVLKGDFVNRGEDALKVVEFVAWLKSFPLFKDKVFLTCGNHELMESYQFALGTKGLFYSCVLDHQALDWEQVKISKPELDYIQSRSAFTGMEQEKLIEYIHSNLNNFYYLGTDARFHNQLVFNEIQQTLDITGNDRLVNALRYPGQNRDIDQKILGRYFLFKEIRDLFDCLPLTINHGNQILLGHTAAVWPDFIGGFAANFYPGQEPAGWLGLSLYWPFTEKGLNLNRDRKGRFECGNTNCYNSIQIFRDLMFADIYDGLGFQLNSKRGQDSTVCKSHAYGHDAINCLLDFLKVKCSISGHQAMPLKSDLSDDWNKYQADARNLYSLGRAIKFQSHAGRGKLAVALEFKASDFEDPLLSVHSIDQLLVLEKIKAHT